jgi:glutathione S-transferase
MVMLTLYYGPGACSMASHIVLEESGEKYNPKRMDLAKGEQRAPDYLKMNPQGRVPLLQLDDGEPLAENTAILPRISASALTSGRRTPKPRRRLCH